MSAEPAAPRPQESTLGRLLEGQAHQRGGHRFLTVDGRHFTYGEFDLAVNRVANGFAARGVRRGDRVGVMLPNSAELLLCLFGLSKLGAISVPINTAYKGDLLAHVLDCSAAGTVVVDLQWLDRVVSVLDRLPALADVIVRGLTPDAGLPVVAGRRWGRLEALPEGVSAAPPAGEVRHDDIQSLMFTSGTTGPSKGVKVTHAHALIAALGFIEFVRPTPEDVMFVAMPLFHGVGFWRILATMMAGASAVVVERFSASQWWESVRETGATVGIGIFAIPSLLLSQPPTPRDRDHRLRVLTPAPSALDQAMFERFGVHTVENYGGTEVGVCVGAPLDQSRPGSCGRPRSEFYDVRILDECDREVPCGEAGEICVRPKVPYAVTPGYYNADDATVAVFRNLWFHTGDRGRFDADGNLYFIDRTKDVVRRRGENISSFEVERVIDTHPAVLESAVIPVPSNLGEDDVKACIVLRESAKLAPADLLDYCQERMPYFMVPRYVEFIAALPRTPTAKVEKYRLRAQGDNGITPQTWDREQVGYVLRR